MTNEEVMSINSLRNMGQGYRVIASALNMPVNSVKSWCRRHPLSEFTESICLQCGKPLICTPHRKKKKYCSDKCRYAWWSAHPEERKPKTLYDHVCAGCGSAFSSARRNTRYCSSTCYAAHRKGDRCE